MNLIERCDALVSLLAGQQRAARNALIAEATRAAASQLKEAHAQSRARVRKLMEEERARALPALSAARARSDSRLRKMRQEQNARSLEAARERLELALERLWKGETRRAWIGHFASLAVELLPRTAWQVNHPADWTGEDSRLLEELLSQRGLPPPQSAVDDSIRAGVRFCAGGMRLDATMEGLLADRYEIDGRLLNYLDGQT